MANIDPYIDAIDNARYGKDVRSAIVNALVAMNAEIEASGVISFNDRIGRVVSAQDDYNINQISSTGGREGQVPVVNKHGGFTLQNVPGEIGVLDDLLDVNIAYVEDGEALVYNSNSEKWTNKDVASYTAEPFKKTSDYGVGAYVTYSGKTYRFIAIHSAGAWNSSHVEEVHGAGQYVTAGKKSNTTLGLKATAEGKNVNASGNYSHAEGLDTKASGTYAHAEGYDSYATGNSSHAEGEATEASHLNSHSEGYYTKTGANYQHVQGMYNVGKSTTLFEIGNGTGVTSSNRSNALEVDTSGNLKATSYSNYSARKYKKNISDMTDDEAKKILLLNPVKYDYKSNFLPDNQYGLIADDVEKIMTYPVVYENGKVDALDYSKLIPALIKMIQIQQKEIDELKR